jgi:ketosteroid isomerase-like protein
MEVTMKRSATIMTLLVLLVIGALSLQTQAGEPKSNASDREFFKALAERTWAAWDTMDMTKIAPFYAKDAEHVFFDVTPLKYQGWAEYEAGAKKLFTEYKSIHLQLGPDFTPHRNGNTAWATSTWRFDTVSTDGKKESLECRWTVVWEKRGNDWLIVHEHVSAPLPVQ